MKSTFVLGKEMQVPVKSEQKVRIHVDEHSSAHVEIIKQDPGPNISSPTVSRALRQSTGCGSPSPPKGNIIIYGG